MKNLFFLPLILHLDDTYFYQKRLLSLGIEIDLRGIEGKKYMCSFETLNVLDSRIPYFRKGIVFLGKGDYHYLTYIFLRRIKEDFILLLLDSHFDDKETFDGFISCGSWVLEALKLKNLKRIVFIGEKEEKLSDKIVKLNRVSEKIIKFIEKFPIYISIDKDVLDRKILITNWGGGFLPLSDLKYLFKILPLERVIGIDICGEPDFNLVEYNKSEEINLEIINILRRELNKEFAI